MTEKEWNGVLSEKNETVEPPKATAIPGAAEADRSLGDRERLLAVKLTDRNIEKLSAESLALLVDLMRRSLNDLALKKPPLFASLKERETIIAALHIQGVKYSTKLCQIEMKARALKSTREVLGEMENKLFLDIHSLETPAMSPIPELNLPPEQKNLSQRGEGLLGAKLQTARYINERLLGELSKLEYDKKMLVDSKENLERSVKEHKSYWSELNRARFKDRREFAIESTSLQSQIRCLQNQVESWRSLQRGFKAYWEVEHTGYRKEMQSLKHEVGFLYRRRNLLVDKKLAVDQIVATTKLAIQENLDDVLDEKY